MEIRLLRDGNLLAIKPLTVELKHLLEEELTYTRLRFIYGAEAVETKRNIDVIPTRCYVYRKDKMITNYGFRSKVTAALIKAGHTVRYADLRPHPDPSVFVPNWELIKDIELRYRQDEVLKAIIANDVGRIDCPAGYGKTFLVRLAGMLMPKAKIGIVVKSLGLCFDMYGELCSTMPSVGLICSGKKTHGRLQIYSAGSLHHSEYKEDILFADEVHELATESFMPTLARFRQAKMFGFSASHDMRLDNADFELHGVFGPVIVSVSQQEAEEHKVVSPVRVQWHDVMMSINPCEGLEGWPKKRDGIARNEVRNNIIAGVAKSYKADEQVLIMVETIEHAAHLKGLLPDFELCYAPDGMSDEQRKRFIRWGLISEDEPIMTREHTLALKAAFTKQKLKKVIATSVWNRGVDFKALQVLIRADAGGSPINDTQIPGRTARIHADKPYGVVHDFRDQFDSSYAGKATRREKSYEQKGWKQFYPEAARSLFRNSKLQGKRA